LALLEEEKGKDIVEEGLRKERKDGMMMMT
jgi:hypothetical protein